MNPLGCYIRARFHRRIFAWFGATILVTGLVTGGFTALVSPTPGWSWQRELERAQRFVGGRFEKVWDDPSARDELARATSGELAIGVVVEDARGQVLSAYGACAYPLLTAPVVRAGSTLGGVKLCGRPESRHRPWRLLFGLGLAGFTLWAMSGRIARRLSRPLGELARVARELGSGNLKARARLGPYADGEAVLLGDAVNEMAERIERQIADQRELLAAVSHELRTPLGHLRLLVELARNGDRSAVEEIDREAVEIDALVGQLLATSKLDFGQLALKKVDPVDAARRALERAALSPELLHVEGALPVVEADPTLLQRALANLLDNARKHGGGATSLSVRRVDSHVCFEVADAGPGFAPGEERHAFDSFHRSSQTLPRDRDSTSLGLGLALVRRIAEAHGGTAYAQNRQGGGATVGFRIRVP